MSKAGPTFAEFLAKAIDQRFESDSAFARAAGVSPSAVSRWLTGEQRPTPPMLERIAAALHMQPATLSSLAYPELARDAAPLAVVEPPAQHPLAQELARILADDSPIPAVERESLETLIDAALQPYRRHLRRRRAS